MNKCIKKIMTTSSLLLTSMYAFNKYIQSSITPITPTKQDRIFTWRDLQITYTEKGNLEKPPLLLIHNLYPSSSKEEWYRIEGLLGTNFHLYELDLPGCGKSDKPNMTYINFMYVQLITAFIKEIINRKTNICVTAFSSSFTFMASRMNPDIINKIIVINPTSIDKLVKPVSKQGNFKKSIIELPIIGTFLYNCKMSKSAITDDYKYIYYYNDKNISSREIEISYYNAHYKHSSGKYLFGSMIGNYTNINIIHAISKINNEIYLIGSGSYKEVIQEYKQYNKNIHAIYVSNCRLLPQLEIPETIVSKINSIFS